jgi:hypothetical protein
VKARITPAEKLDGGREVTSAHQPSRPYRTKRRLRLVIAARLGS